MASWGFTLYKPLLDTELSRTTSIDSAEQSRKPAAAVKPRQIMQNTMGFGVQNSQEEDKCPENLKGVMLDREEHWKQADTYVRKIMFINERN